MSKRNGKFNPDDYFSNQNYIKVLNTNKFQPNSIIYSKFVTNKNINNINNQITSIEFNNLNKYQKYLSPGSFINEQGASKDNLKKVTYFKYDNTRNKNISKNSTKNLRTKSTKRENHSKTKFYDYSNKLNDSLIKYKNKKNNSNLKKKGGSKKSPSHKMISYNPSFFVHTPKSSRSRSRTKSRKKAKSSRSTKKSKDDGNLNNYSLIIYKNKINNIQKASSNTEIKKESKNHASKPKSISKKKTIGLKNSNIMINKSLNRGTSYDSQKNIRIVRNRHIEKSVEMKNKKEVNNYNHIGKRNIYINLNVDNLSFNKKIFFSTENNTNPNTNYNSNDNSNNNTIKIKNINVVKNINNKYDIKENKFKTNHKEYNIKEQKEKSFFVQNFNKSKENKNKIERKKLSFDIIEDNQNIKNVNKDILTKIIPNNNTKTKIKSAININVLNSSSQKEKSSLILKIDNNIKNKNNFQYINKNIKNKKDNLDNKNKNDELGNIEENGYQFVTENDQGMNTGINSVKTNNFVINKPKEENLKYSSIKEFLDDNEEQTEISPSQISKIIIGQIDGYKDIIDEDKNINTNNDKSKSLLELLSKYSFSYIKNNRQSIENLDNLNLFEESNDIKGEMNDNILNINMTNNSRNITSDNNMPNLTNIKNVDEDYDSEDLSISVFKNNIKSINTHSKSFLNKIFFNKSNTKNKSKNNIQHKNFVKISMNTNNTTISSGNNINKDNLKSNKDLINKEKTNKNSKFSKNKCTKKISPSSSARYNLTNSKILKNSSNSKDKKYNVNNKNEKHIIYLKNINKSKILKKIETAKRQNAIRANINKNIDTNILFNTDKKNKKIKMIKNINELMEKPPITNINNIESKLDEENNQTKKISNYDIPVLKIIEENENIIKAYLNDIEKQKNEQNDENICNKSDNNTSINDKNSIQCFIF